MSRLERPLDRTAMRAADEQLYAAHEGDVRPNSLFDANGNRKPLSAENDTFAEEWKYYYRASLPQAGGEKGKTSSASNGQSPAVAVASAAPVAQQPRHVGQVVTTCPRKHWIQIALTKLPDLQTRPDWWPERGEPNYPGEPFIADITDGRKNSKLSGNSDTRYDDIPAGACRIQFPTFYLEIEARFKKSKLGAGAKPMLPAKLELTKLDPYFAPGLEPLDIVYTIENLAGETVWCNIESTRDPGVTLFRHKLSGAELADGTGKKLKWDGFATGGKLSGKWIDPAWSPYLVSLSVDDSSNDYGGIESSKTTEVLIHKLVTDLSANAQNRIILNVPGTKVDAITEVLIRKKAGGSAVTPIEIDVLYTFTRGKAPVTAAGSFAYSGAKTLGKLGDQSAVYWAPHAHCPSISKDGYRNSCVAKTMTADPGRGIAAAYFIPSAVGGNRYTVKAQVLAAEDDKTVLAEDTSPEVTIWRKIKLDAYEMWQ